MTTENATPQPDHQDDCLMCAVRALTSGNPSVIWNPDTEGQSVTGVVLRRGEMPSRFQPSGKMPFLDLWTGGMTRVRVPIGPMSLRQAVEGAELEIGDTVMIWFDGWTRNTRPMKQFRVEVRRGH